MDSFWSGGKASYLKALALEEAAEIAGITKKLRTEDDADIRKTLEKKLLRVKGKYARKRREAEDGLY